MNFSYLSFTRLFLNAYRMIFFLAFIVPSNLAYARIIKIPEQYNIIQMAIDKALNGDTILIKRGRYFESINFKGKAITVGSYYLVDGDTCHISKTIIKKRKGLFFERNLFQT